MPAAGPLHDEIDAVMLRAQRAELMNAWRSGRIEGTPETILRNVQQLSERRDSENAERAGGAGAGRAAAGRGNEDLRVEAYVRDIIEITGENYRIARPVWAEMVEAILAHAHGEAQLFEKVQTLRQRLMSPGHTKPIKHRAPYMRTTVQNLLTQLERSTA